MSKQNICDTINTRIQNGEIISPCPWALDIVLSEVRVDDFGDYQILVNSDSNWHTVLNNIIVSIYKKKSYKWKNFPITSL